MPLVGNRGIIGYARSIYWKKPEKIFSGGKGGRGPPNFDQRLFQKGGEGFAGPVRKPIADLAIFCAGKRRQTPARAGMSRRAPVIGHSSGGILIPAKMARLAKS